MKIIVALKQTDTTLETEQVKKALLETEAQVGITLETGSP
jgi:hypothetical protein